MTNEKMKENKVKIEKTEIFNSENKTRNKKFSKLVDWLIVLPIYLVIILLPLFFLNKVPSAFELNKQALLVSLVGISFLFWVGKMAWNNEIRFKKTLLIIPVFTFLLVYSLSAIFSDYYEQSMWGYFGGESASLVTILFLIAFFVLIYNNIRSHQDVAKYIFSFLISGLILSIFSILQFFSINLLPFDYAQSKFFNSIGSSYIYSIFVALIFLVSISLFLGKISKWIRFFLLILSIFSFFVLVAINFKILWIVLLIMLAFVLCLTILIEDKKPSQARIVPMIFLVLTLFLILRSKPLIDNSDLPIEVFIKPKTAAEIFLKSIKNDPLLGSGPTTFANVYKKNRPNNLGDFSTVNFNESTSFFFTLISTTGILGTLSFLFIVVVGLIVLFKNLFKVLKKEDKKSDLYSYLNVAVSISWVFLTIFQFLYTANITILLLWWLFFALLVSLSFLNSDTNNNNELVTTSENPKVSFVLSFGFVLVIIAFIAVLYLQSQKYIAAFYFQQALVASNSEGSLEKTAEKMSKAVSLDPNRDSFFRDLAVVHLAFAKEKIIEKGIQNLTPEESNYVSARFRSALQSLNKAKELNPYNSLNLVSVANLYKEFISIQKESGEKAIENYSAALELDPKNPEIYQAMANVQISLADIEIIEANSNSKEEVSIPQKSKEHLAMAEEYLKNAIEIKPNHVGSNLLLVSVYEKSNKLDEAIEKAKENIEIYPNSADLLVDLGRIYYSLDRFDDAEEYIRKGLSFNPNYANALYLLGLTLDKKGKKEEALSEFEKIKENNPDNELLNQIISNLKSGKEALSEIGVVQEENNFSEISSDSEEEILENQEQEIKDNISEENLESRERQ